MRYDAEHKASTRTRVLKEAAKAIRTQGPHRIAVAGVMKKAGLTHGGFYAHFRSREAMVGAAIERMFEEANARWASATAGRSAADGLCAFIDFYLSPAHRDAHAVGCPVAALLGDLPRLAPSWRRAFAAGVRRWTDAVAQRLIELGRENAEALASSAVAELAGALALARGESDATRSDARLAASRHLIKQRLGLED
ncbi:MAG: TetR/AcrR family transcriptional regulator [Acidobacteria bacterium]|nr:TetR/AcrR family transcriptional regulator [Acidobacteriota bacterium]